MNELVGQTLMGQRLGDRYLIQSSLGYQKGRRTLLATDLQTNSSVVVKLLLFGPDFSWDDLKLFEREAGVLKALAHSAIPQYLDSFEVNTALGKGFALVQTYIEAKSLQHWIKAGRTFSEDDLKAIAEKLLNILDYLHSRQPCVIHRDLKPSNVLLSDRSGNSIGQLYLVDFGSVQTAVSAETGTRTVVGTYGYMPPEQFGSKVVPASDLYALGMTLIYMATGQHPSELPQRGMRVLFTDQVSLSSNLIHWIEKLTELSVDQRFKSAKDAVRSLHSERSQKNDSALLYQPDSRTDNSFTTNRFSMYGRRREFIVVSQKCYADAKRSEIELNARIKNLGTEINRSKVEPSHKSSGKNLKVSGFLVKGFAYLVILVHVGKVVFPIIFSCFNAIFNSIDELIFGALNALAR